MVDLQQRIEQFHRDGYLIIPDVLSRDEVVNLREGVERAFAKTDEEAELYHMPDMWRPRMFEHGEAFEALVDHPGIIDLIEALLDSTCHLIANSALRTLPGRGISSWHADETIRFPLPRDVPLDSRIQMPCFVINLNYYLCDVDEELGPTQFVPTSHRSGRNPEDEDRDEEGNPFYLDNGVVSALSKAGTCVMWHDQIWHRGAPNQSKDRIRWVLQAPYARRFISQRFYPFIKYRMPEGILEHATPRRKRLLGLHTPGAYG